VLGPDDLRRDLLAVDLDGLAVRQAAELRSLRHTERPGAVRVEALLAGDDHPVLALDAIVALAEDGTEPFEKQLAVRRVRDDRGASDTRPTRGASDTRPTLVGPERERRLPQCPARGVAVDAADFLEQRCGERSHSVVPLPLDGGRRVAKAHSGLDRADVGLDGADERERDAVGLADPRLPDCTEAECLDPLPGRGCVVDEGVGRPAPLEGRPQHALVRRVREVPERVEPPVRDDVADGPLRLPDDPLESGGVVAAADSDEVFARGVVRARPLDRAVGCDSPEVEDSARHRPGRVGVVPLWLRAADLDEHRGGADRRGTVVGTLHPDIVPRGGVSRERSEDTRVGVRTGPGELVRLAAVLGWPEVPGVVGGQQFSGLPGVPGGKDEQRRVVERCRRTVHLEMAGLELPEGRTVGSIHRAAAGAVGKRVVLDGLPVRDRPEFVTDVDGGAVGTGDDDTEHHRRVGSGGPKTCRTGYRRAPATISGPDAGGSRTEKSFSAGSEGSDMILPGAATQTLAVELASETGRSLASIERERFPDGEAYCRVDEDLDRALVVASTVSAAAHIDLLQLQDAAREAGATEVTTVVPYMGYARQDRAFEHGESVSARAMARAISTGTDRVLTVNPHEADISDFFDVPATAVDAAGLLAEPLPALSEPLFLSPDSGAVALAESVRAAHGRGDVDYFEKTRHSGTDVGMEPSDTSVGGRDVVLVDDIIATGSTMSEAVSILQERDAARVFVTCVHPLFARNARVTLGRAGVAAVYGTDTIERPASAVSAASAIADAL